MAHVLTKPFGGFLDFIGIGLDRVPGLGGVRTLEWHHQPQNQVADEPDAAGEEQEDGDDANDHRIDVEILGQSAADTANDAISPAAL